VSQTAIQLVMYQPKLIQAKLSKKFSMVIHLLEIKVTIVTFVVVIYFEIKHARNFKTIDWV
jgi:hypothetical protein